MTEYTEGSRRNQNNSPKVAILGGNMSQGFVRFSVSFWPWTQVESSPSYVKQPHFLITEHGFVWEWLSECVCVCFLLCNYPASSITHVKVFVCICVCIYGFQFAVTSDSSSLIPPECLALGRELLLLHSEEADYLLTRLNTLNGPPIYVCVRVCVCPCVCVCVRVC